MTTEKKQQQVENFTQLINDAEAAISINYVGLTVSQQQELRDELRKTDAQFRVIKNTLFKIATKNTGNEELNQLINGPTALIATKEDIVSPARIIMNFLKNNEDAIQINNGYYFGNIVDPEYIKDISNIPTKEVLLGKISGQLIGQISNFMNLSKNSISKFQMLIGALTEKRADEAPADEAPADEAPAEEAPADEAPAD
ncbi:MAG: 50S ribosomal protein L10, partial [Chloroflexi bacterium]|nr:50S ribosomal protein L10 [Chloroflexota bacterium]